MNSLQLQMIWPPRKHVAEQGKKLSSGYRIRPFRDGDESAWLELMKSAGFNNWTAARLAIWRDKVIPKGLLVAECRADGVLAATAMAVHRPQPLHAQGGELGWVACRPEHRGRGLGHRLCCAAVNRFLAAGYDRIYLQTDDWREAAVATYLKMGFVPFLYAEGMDERWTALCARIGQSARRRHWVSVPSAKFVPVPRPPFAENAVWREKNENLRRRRIWREELDEFMPERILDFHAHVMNEGVVPDNEIYDCAGHPLLRYDLDDFSRDMALFYPRRQTAAVCFGMPHRSFDMARNNRYIAEACDGRRFFPFRLFDPNESDRDAVREDIVRGAFAGLKPYLNYVNKPNANDVTIRDMLPDWIMRIADELGLIVMLHIPRRMRLADPLNQRQIPALCRRFPGAKIVLAHVGRAYYLKNIVGYLDKLKGLENLWYDLAMVNNWEVLEYLFRFVAPEKILYATDAPIAMAPGKSVEINHQYSYITPTPWRLSIADTQGKVQYASFLYEELRAIRKACERLGMDRAFVRGLFWDHGMKLLGLK